MRQVQLASRLRLSESREPVRRLLVKVPKLTIYFWIIKIMTTAMGESLSDYMVHNFNPYIAVIAGFVVFVVALVLQFSRRIYEPWAYWLAVTMVAVFGTMVADVLHIEFGVPYTISALGFGLSLIVVFTVWYKTEQTLSIHSIYTFRREAFYWLAVLATFAMGTAAGDLAAYTAHLGFFTAGLLFTGIFALPALGYWLFRLNGILAFWLAYVMTRPLGASFADWFGKSPAVGGLNIGDGPVVLTLGIAICLLVGYLSVSGVDCDTRRSQGDPA